SRFHFVICALGIFASVLFLGQFLSTFDPHYRVNDRLFSYLLRGLLLAATVTSLLSLGPGRFLRVPRWLLAGVGLVAAGWLFVYACPSIVREWYGTRTEPSEMFPKGVLWFTRSNPERDIQEQMLYAFVAAWLVMIVVGRIRNRRAANQAARQTMED
ncbi:MAG: hypothetical protein JW810_05980, partial [Sedimentisphaerales bacterium]|nr:hypothetical protein [Sedimentisphaerales bacterium]